MVNKVLLFILIALIAVQSVDAVADAVKFHQPDTPYSEADYFVSPNIDQIIDTLATNNQSSTDESTLDHCCYCHGVSSGVFTDHSLAFTAISGEANLTRSQLSYISQLISPDLRPPIV